MIIDCWKAAFAEKQLLLKSSYRWKAAIAEKQLGQWQWYDTVTFTDCWKAAIFEKQWSMLWNWWKAAIAEKQLLLSCYENKNFHNSITFLPHGWPSSACKHADPLSSLERSLRKPGTQAMPRCKLSCCAPRVSGHPAQCATGWTFQHLMWANQFTNGLVVSHLLCDNVSSIFSQYLLASDPSKLLHHPGSWSQHWSQISHQGQMTTVHLHELASRCECKQKDLWWWAQSGPWQFRESCNS